MQSHHHTGGDALPDFVRHRGWRRALFLSVAGALVLGAIGYRQYDPEIRWVDALYHSAQHFMMHAPHLELEHERWNAERWEAGWSYADKKDVARRLNPNLVPWHDLKPKIQRYDHDSVRLLPNLLETAGMKIVIQETIHDTPSALATKVQ